MHPAFRTGQIIACSDLLAVIPCPALVKAIVSHATTQPDYDGQPMRTVHEHGSRRFVMETPSRGDKTLISLI